MRDGVVTLFLCGDVMLGRGVDQVLACPGDPALREGWIRDARAYVELAEAANGPIPAPVPLAWPWGEALRVLAAAAPDVRIVNLETSVTRGDTFAPGKEVHYRMHPANVALAENLVHAGQAAWWYSWRVPPRRSRRRMSRRAISSGSVIGV
ncbi:hypothetical protein C1I97_26245, partial [Streptomyces sp. NTH33]|uniref:CapA family protein n=1 Tax=Streptomyces sp. NTH33 TaxID=1735453 RepID=UPI000DB26999